MLKRVANSTLQLCKSRRAGSLRSFKVGKVYSKTIINFLQ